MREIKFRARSEVSKIVPDPQHIYLRNQDLFRDEGKPKLKESCTFEATKMITLNKREFIRKNKPQTFV